MDDLRLEEEELLQLLEMTRREIAARRRSTETTDVRPSKNGRILQRAQPDENIQRVLDVLNNPRKQDDETSSDYEYCIAASRRQQGIPVVNGSENPLSESDEENSRGNKSVRRSRRTEKQKERDGENRRLSSAERREHYRDWLNTQLYLDSMREDDLRATGRSSIPAREKRAEYPGMGTVHPQPNGLKAEHECTRG